MRIFLPNATRPKKAAKHIARLVGVSLSRSQFGAACALGYQDWHELEHGIGGSQSSPLDQDLSDDDFCHRHARLSLALARALDIPNGDAQYALSAARLTGDRPLNLADQIAIRLACFRATSLSHAGPRQPGAVGVVKSPGLNGKVVILRDFGKPTLVMSHDNYSMMISDSEFVTPQAVLPLFMPMRLYMPYGFWTEEDGSQVVFSRDYKPMWRIRQDRTIERLEPWLWIKYVGQTFLRDPSREPLDAPGVAARLGAWLSDRGITGLPILADALPALVHDRRFSMNDATHLLQQARSPAVSMAVT